MKRQLSKLDAEEKNSPIQPLQTTRRQGFAALPRSVLAALSDLVMPPVCLACHLPIVNHHAVCAACWREIDFISAPVCDRLGVPMPFDTGDNMISAAAAANPPPYDRARAVGHFEGTLKTLISDFKFRDRHELRRLFVRWLAETGREFWPEADLIVPVPLHPYRLLRRRFNQAAVLANEVARDVNIAFRPLLLRRTRATPHQLGLNRQQRRDNVRGAFAVPDHMATGLNQARVVLVDDVITTGATIGACAKALRHAGAARVDVLALAMVTDTASIGT